MKKKVMIVFGLGGHAAQLIRLVKQMDLKKNDYFFIVGKGDSNTKNLVEKRLNTKDIIETVTPRLEPRNRAYSTIRTLYAFFRALPLIFRIRPDVVISAGQAVALPVSVAAKLFGAKIIYLETWSRVRTKSMSGRYFYGENPLRWKLADLFFIQWPEAKENYPDAIYAGRLG